MIGIFKNKNPLALVLLGILSSSLWWNNPAVIATDSLGTSIWGEWLWTASNTWISGGLLWSKIAISTLYFLLAFFLNNTMNEFKLMDRPSYIPALCFMLILLLLPQTINLLYLLVCFLFLLSLRLLVASYKTSNPTALLLLIGALSGVLILINSIFLLAYLWATFSLLIMRPASWREWLILSLGSIAPFYIVASYLYLTDNFEISKLISGLQLEFRLPDMNTMSWIKTGIVLISAWLGLSVANSFLNKMMIQGRKAYLTMILLYFIALLACLIQPNQIEHYLFLFLPPCAMLLSPFFTSFKRNYIPNLILFAILILSMIR